MATKKKTAAAPEPEIITEEQRLKRIYDECTERFKNYTDQEMLDLVKDNHKFPRWRNSQIVSDNAWRDEMNRRKAEAEKE